LNVLSFSLSKTQTEKNCGTNWWKNKKYVNKMLPTIMKPYLPYKRQVTIGPNDTETPVIRSKLEPENLCFTGLLNNLTSYFYLQISE
jgi:hypothetical protein